MAMKSVQSPGRFSYFLKLTGFQRKSRGYELIEYIILTLKENPI
jgi:hypothetical protein